MLHLVPPLVLFLAKDPQVLDYDISSVRKVICGAAPLGVGVSREFATRSKGMLLQGGRSFVLAWEQVQVKGSPLCCQRGSPLCCQGGRSRSRAVLCAVRGAGPSQGQSFLLSGGQVQVRSSASLFHSFKGNHGCQGVGTNTSLLHLIKGKRGCQGVGPDTSLLHLIKGNRGCQEVGPNTSLLHLKVKTCVRHLNGKQTKKGHMYK